MCVIDRHVFIKEFYKMKSMYIYLWVINIHIYLSHCQNIKYDGDGVNRH